MTINTKLFAALVVCSLALNACKKNGPIAPDVEVIVPEEINSFKEVAAIDLGGEFASEISTYDPSTKKLFVVSNDGGTKVDIVDMSNYPTVTKLKTITFAANAGINSVAVSNGLLAIALNGVNPQANGDIVVLKTTTLEEVKKISVGSMPDMVTFSPDGNYIISANEGEPSDDYTVDPVGSISVINIKNNYAVKTLDFSGFANDKATLVAAGLRIYGPNASFAQDIEPEYIAVASDSKKAFVTLQENNGVAEIDLIGGTITKIMPLGVRDISLAENAWDVSDDEKSGKKIKLETWPIKAFYLPDAISYFSAAGSNYLALANEGDTRAWKGYDEEARVKSLTLDPAKFPNAATLQLDVNLGRLTVTSSAGFTLVGGNKVYQELYAPGGRSMSIINASTGQLVANIGRELEQKVIEAGKYDDTRSDNKGVEVESVTVAQVNGKTLAFIGMERVDHIAVYDVSTPAAPSFVQLFATGDAPEGLLFVKPKDSPNGRSLLIVSNEGDGTVRFYQPNKL